MGLFLRQDENRSELQTRVAAELQEKLRSTPQIDDLDAQESKFLENQHETRPAGVLIGLLILVAVVLTIFVVTR
jgi:hypothetical protein